MTPERWHEVERLLHGALERTPAERAAFLDAASGGDASLRAEVESLLASAPGAEGYLEGGAVEDAAALLEQTEPPPLVGSRLGSYVIEARLGAGGMGEVYLAHDDRLDRKVALKLLDPVIAGDAGARARFLREARLASSLDHPNVCTIHEVGEADGRAFMAMQYVEGRRLDEVTGGRPLPPSEMLPLALQVADALAAAHEKGIVHRDLKTANVIVTARGQAKVLDFGIAKRLSETGPADDPRLTATGTVLGTPASMSPEQACGGAIDHRSDVFSLGVLMYEMATGRAPFEGKSRAEVMRALLGTAHVPAAEVNPEVPASLSAVIDRALAKEPDRRPQTMDELMAELRRAAHDAGLSSSALAPVAVTSGRAGLRRRVPPRAVALSLVAAVILAGIAAVVALRTRGVAPAPIRSLAVLPFKPLVAEQRDEALELGMADTLITRLGSVGQLRVRPLSAVRKYAAGEQDAVAAGREQRVDAVLDAHIQKAGETVRVTVRLVRVADEAALWADRFDIPMGGIFAVQDTVAERVAAALMVHLSGDEKARLTRRGTTDVEAYRQYLLGRYHLNRWTDEGFWKARDHFQEAIRRDPNYAPAHAGMADVYHSLSGFNVVAPKDGFPKARQAAEQALRLDEGLAEAHTALAVVTLLHDWNPAQAEREFKRALELNPGYADAHMHYGLFLAFRGRFEEAIREAERALELDPLSPARVSSLGEVLHLSRRFDEAAAQQRKALEMDPNFGFGHWSLGRALTGKGLYDEAIAAFQKSIPLSGDSPDEPAELARAYALAGRRREALAIVDDLKRRSERRYIAPSVIASIYGALGDRDEAFSWLERAHAERDFVLVSLEVEPMFDPLRADPRFGELLAKR